MRWLTLFLVLLPGLAFGAVSNTATTRRDAVSLISQSNAAPGGQVQLALRFQLAPGWHIYWSNPGDAGVPPQLALAAPAAAGPLAFPPPQILLQAGVAAYVLSGDVVLPFPATHVGNSVTADAQWLVCRDICVPEHGHFKLPLNGGASAEAAWFSPPQAVASPFAARLALDGTLSVAGPQAAQIAAARFFPDTPGLIVNRAPQPLRFTRAGLTLRLTPVAPFKPGQGLSGVLELTDPSGAMQALTLRAAPGPAGTPLALWLGLAGLGGLLLNLMPCVFPVLAMKLFSLARLGGAARRDIRREAVGYSAGVLCAMAALGGALLLLRAAGQSFGWGFQFQSPVFVALIAWLVFGAGLSLAGGFELTGIPGLGNLAARHGSFLTGLLAVLAATPCTAPFMAGAIAAALAAPAIAAFGIFLALGAGLAAPFLVIALLPRLIAWLPRPGRWMLVLQRLLSLPMFLTALWLCWVMRREAGPAGLLLLLAGAACLAAALASRRLRPLAILAVLPLIFLHPAPAGAALSLPNAAPYTPQRLAALRAANQPVLVDMTAAWCITCLVNERTTLASPAVQRALASTGTKTLVGDWTNRDPAITAFLQANNRDGVPLYVLYPTHGAPTLLPQVLTPDLVARALR